MIISSPLGVERGRSISDPLKCPGVRVVKVFELESTQEFFAIENISKAINN
jgi:hypothetical protein